MTSVVLDASALIAVMNSEPGAEVVRPVLGKAIISAVNYSEVLKKTIERCQTIGPVVAFVHGFSIEIVPFDESLATTSAELFPQTKPQGMPSISMRAPSCPTFRRTNFPAWLWPPSFTSKAGSGRWRSAR